MYKQFEDYIITKCHLKKQRLLIQHRLANKSIIMLNITGEEVTIIVNKKCKLCNAPRNEKVEHVFLCYPAFNHQRKLLLSSYRTMTNTWKVVSSYSKRKLWTNSEQCIFLLMC